MTDATGKDLAPTTKRDVAEEAVTLHKDLERIGVGTTAAQDRIDEFARLAFAAGRRSALVAVPSDAGDVLADLNFARQMLEALLKDARRIYPETLIAKTLDDAERALTGIARASDFILRGRK